MENTFDPQSSLPTRNLQHTVLKYLVVCSALTLLNLYTGGSGWVLWIWGAWGVALLLRAIAGTSTSKEDEAEYSANPRTAFYRHLVAYIFVMGMLALVNYLYTPAYPWVLWPAAGWGLGLALQGINVFAGNRR